MKQAINRAAALGTESVSTDDQLLDLWLHGKSANTRRTYRREAMCFLAFVEKSIFHKRTGHSAGGNSGVSLE